LETFSSFPGNVAEVAVQNLLDQILYARDVRDQWDTFYRAHKSTIWRTEFGQIGKWQSYQQEWERCVVGLKDVALHLS
jgi:hypothetical protein